MMINDPTLINGIIGLLDRTASGISTSTPIGFWTVDRSGLAAGEGKTSRRCVFLALIADANPMNHGSNMAYLENTFLHVYQCEQSH